MNELISLHNVNRTGSVDNLKREFLFFDKVLIVGLGEFDQVIEKNVFNSMEDVLSNKGLLSLMDLIIYNSFFFMKEATKKYGGWSAYYAQAKNEELEHRNTNLDFLINKGKVILDYNYVSPKSKASEVENTTKKVLKEKLDTVDKSLQGMLDLATLCLDLKARILANSSNRDKFTVIPNASSVYEIENITNKKAEVYNLILDDFPIIDTSQLSWEQIFDFREDQDATSSIWGLRNWISKISHSDMEIHEIEEEYRHLKNQFEKHIKLHKMKAGTSVFQTCILAGAQLIENAAKLDFKSASDIFVTLRKNKIALMEAELKAQGNQLSYLYTVKDRFS